MLRLWSRAREGEPNEIWPAGKVGGGGGGRGCEDDMKML